MKQLKKFATAVAVTIFFFVVLDFLGGLVCDKLYHDAKYSLFARQNYVLKESTNDIVIIGSSRASHHYIPSIFTDSLGMSCFNAGSDGMCVYYHYGVVSAILERGHKPKMVIYEVMPTDIQVSNGATFTLEAALNRFAPHYGEFACLDSLFQLQGKLYVMKLHSNLYRFNSLLIQLINCRFLQRAEEDNGYERLDGVITETDLVKSDYVANIEDLKLEYFYKLVNKMTDNGIKLYLVYSPLYGKYHSKGIDKIKEIAKENGVMFIDFSTDSSMIKPQYFRDTEHLNHEGATLFSKKVVEMIKYNQ